MSAWVFYGLCNALSSLPGEKLHFTVTTEQHIALLLSVHFDAVCCSVVVVVLMPSFVLEIFTRKVLTKFSRTIIRYVLPKNPPLIFYPNSQQRRRAEKCRKTEYRPTYHDEFESVLNYTTFVTQSIMLRLVLAAAALWSETIGLALMNAAEEQEVRDHDRP